MFSDQLERGIWSYFRDWVYIIAAKQDAQVNKLYNVSYGEG